jgi:hypothetical protein
MSIQNVGGGGGAWGGLRSPEEFLEPLTGKNILCGQIVTPPLFYNPTMSFFSGFSFIFFVGGGGEGTINIIFSKIQLHL